MTQPYNSHERIQTDKTFVETPQISPTTSVIKKPVPAVIPPEHSSRTLVLCFDGTGDQLVHSG